MSAIDAHSLAVDPPTGWEGRIFRRREAGELRVSEVTGATAPTGERTFPVLHVATVPLPIDAADYGNGIVEYLGAGDVLVVLKEFDPVEASQPLFARELLPRTLDPELFTTNGLQRQLPRQAGLQVFFHEGGRAFCLYVVLGDFARRNEVVPRVNQVLASVLIDPISLEPAP